MIGFGRGLRGEEVFLTPLEIMLKFWEETSLRINQSHVMVALKVISKGEMGGKWHMLPFVDVTGSGI